jgi:predicted dehydrogenase
MSPRTPIRVLLIGTGFGAQVHAPGFARHPAFALAGVASGSLENAKRVASEFAIPYAGDDWKRMLEEVEADLVSIATPVDLHYPAARAALEHGRHVLCEKPFAMNVAEARELAALADSKGLVNVVNHEFRHYPARETLTRKIREGTLGRVEHMLIRDRIPGWARNPKRRLTWLTEKKRGGGYLGALGSHHIDQLILWGGPIRKVFCTLRTLAAESKGSEPALAGITADDTFTLLVQFENGARGVVDLFGGAHVRGQSMEVVGSADSMTVLDGYRLGRPKEDGSHEAIPIPEDLAIQPTPETALLAPFLVKLEMLRAAIQEGKPASPDFEDAVEIQKVLDAGRLSDQSGAWESLAD